MDEEDENQVANELPVCPQRCGRNVAPGLGRNLKRNTYCCTLCMESKGMRHCHSCNSNSYTVLPVGACRKSTDPPYADLSSADLTHRAALLLESIPHIDTEIDAKTCRTLFDCLCVSNSLPCLDEKRFLLIFSRFCSGQSVPRFRARELFYVLIKKILRNVDVSRSHPVLARHFFVTKKVKVSRHYRFRSIIGEGSFGIVHKVIRIDSGIERVCKTIRKSITNVPLSQIESEIRVVAALDHPNIIKITEYFEDDNDVHLIMEYCPDGDLLGRIKHSIKSGKPLSPLFVKNIIRQLLGALSFMEAHRIIHKDLKPENIMLVNDANNLDNPIVKIIDFGLSEIFATDQSHSTTVAGTAFYMSPQIFKPPFGFKADVWSVGVIGYFMLTGILPFFGSTVTEVKSNVLYRKIQWPYTFVGTPKPLQVTADARDLIEKMLDKDEALRPNAVEALNHSWMLNPNNTGTPRAFSLHVALNMVSYSRLSWWKRCMLNLVAHIWEFTDISTNLAQIFLDLDRKRDGCLSIPEVANSLERLTISSHDAWKCAKAIDLTHSGAISYNALVASCIYPLMATEPRIIRCLFNYFDPDKRDRITADVVFETVFKNHSYRTTIERDHSKSELVEELSTFISKTKTATDPSKSRAAFESRTIAREVDISTFRRWLTSIE